MTVDLTPHTPRRDGACLPTGRGPTAGARVVLVGDPGAGKTTTARFLARWWLAKPEHLCRVITDNPYEYGDLTERPERRCVVTGTVNDAAPAFDPDDPSDGRLVLTIIDTATSLDRLSVELLTAATKSAGPVVLTSTGVTGWAVTGSRVCLAVLPPLIPFGLHDHRSHFTPSEEYGGQGRLDWPDDAAAVVLDPRGPVDHPPHRWSQAVDGAA